MSEGQPKEPPPASLTRRWDKVKWHVHGVHGPRDLTAQEAGCHVFAALEFLASVNQLTAAGKRELAARSGDGAGLLRDHVKAGARAFLDGAYDAYLERCNYGQSPPTQILETAWVEYANLYDVSKRPKADPFQRLLMRHSHELKLSELLSAVAENETLAEQLRDAVPFAPEAERELIEKVLRVAKHGPASEARGPGDPVVAARAVKFSGDIAGKLAAAAELSKRIGDSEEGLVAVVAATNLGQPKQADAALAALGRGIEMLSEIWHTGCSRTRVSDTLRSVRCERLAT